MSDEPVVLDASAVLALLQGESGAAAVASLLPRAVISAVNLAEIVAKLIDAGVPADAARTALDALHLTVHSFDQDAAYATAALRLSTRKAGLSLGDRACLALAVRLAAPAVTADRGWTTITTGLPDQLPEIMLIR
ncbi:MAG TPA: type II toxin-antitoxin system VapC family toxin [Rhodopila sp.]|nr:type II toxin-antitoxin system VapC family toxin [Rhodopila sp.]